MKPLTTYVLALLGHGALAQATPSALQSHVKFLSDDMLEGRGTPGRGLDLAAQYIASQLQLVGAKPGPEGYFQKTEYENNRTGAKGRVANVVGIVPGTDPVLAKSFVIVSAHYDHLGQRVNPNEPMADSIFNGANDDASGVSGVIEIARALSEKPAKRSVVFLCFWGEELGMRGSRHYVQNPLFSLKDTVANINLEQIGRIDDDEGPRVAEFNVTGFDLSDLAWRMSVPASESGVKVTMHPRLSTMYFGASDNIAFASVGVVAHTVSTSYSFPDYHKSGDEWPKLHYDNFAKIVNAVTAGVRAIADGTDVPQWDAGNTRAGRYLEAYKKLHSQSLDSTVSKI